ncbi:hypothetical protein C9374_013451 [Naegleria lovaniensis]|uniref:Uncharacterized protein n=1 Tax=Naegleria lovaniensis TaxID=51637 RepID=A0AA88H0K9_NAELO|nr:uncharacterized protein C9374_013451 [Naegleria lovaniensis]KAG2391966.1 hypothetical protein C9374_013451 [Naegleria lovaniensis]
MACSCSLIQYLINNKSSLPWLNSQENQLDLLSRAVGTIGNDLVSFLNFYNEKSNGEAVRKLLLNCSELDSHLTSSQMKSEDEKQVLIQAFEFSESSTNMEDNKNTKQNSYYYYSESLPFTPKTFRDASLWLSHNIKAARGIAKISLPLAYYGIIFPFENIFPRTTFPMFTPSKSFFDHPLFYVGNAMTFYGNGSEISYPFYTKYLDYELEIGAIVTKEIRNATCEEAENAIGGYVLLNDFSDRSNQFNEMTKDRFGPNKCKSFGTGMGSVVVTPDEMKELSNQGLQGKVLINGKKVVESKKFSLNTSGKSIGEPPFYSMGETIAYMSSSETIYPGELVGSGTIPNMAGIENGTQLREGDSVTLSMQPFGALTHKIGPKDKVDLIAGLLYYLPTGVDTRYWLEPQAKTFEQLSAPIYYVQKSENVDAIYKNGNFYSPESLTVRNGYIYSGLYDGSIRRVKVLARRNTSSDHQVEFNYGTPEIVAYSFMWKGHNIPTPEKCSNPQHVGKPRDAQLEKECGRPLQAKFDRKGILYVTDAVFGLLKISSQKHQKIELDNGALASDIVVERVLEIPFANALIISEPYIYVSMTSTKFSRNKHILEILDGGANGGLFKYHMQTKQSEMIATDLHFANGMVLYNHSIYVAETDRFRISRIDLATREKTIHVDNLMCVPDNLSVVKKNGKPLVWIGCAGPRIPTLKFLYTHPSVTIQLSKFEYLVEQIFQIVRKKIGIAIQMDLFDKKEVTKVMYDATGNHYHWISEMVEVQLVASDSGEWPLQLAEADESNPQNYYLVGNVNYGAKLALVSPIPY